MHDGTNRTVSICDSCGEEKWVFAFDEYPQYDYLCSHCYYNLDK